MPTLVCSSNTSSRHNLDDVDNNQNTINTIMTHEADNTNFAMSLMEDRTGEAAFFNTVNKVKGRKDQFSPKGSGEETRRDFGRWSNQDKSEWECGTCTFLNQPLFLSCEMCGQPRPEEEAGVVEADVSAPEETAAHQQQELNLEQEERMLKKERIKEIMALQQGIFNKIKEEKNEIEELEGSFAWMDLDENDTLPMKELTASTAARSSAANTKAINGKKPAAMEDASTGTAATAAMSSFSGSSRFSLDLSNSQTSRNSAIPVEALASLKEESSFNRGTFATSHGNHLVRSSHSSGEGVDFNALKAAVDGASVPRGLHLESNHSVVSSMGVGSSIHSVEGGGEANNETPRDHTRRRSSALVPPSSSNNTINAVVVSAMDALGGELDHETHRIARPSFASAGAVSKTRRGFPAIPAQLQRQHRRPSEELPPLNPIGAVPGKRPGAMSVAGPGAMSVSGPGAMSVSGPGQMSDKELEQAAARLAASRSHPAHRALQRPSQVHRSSPPRASRASPPRAATASPPRAAQAQGPSPSRPSLLQMPSQAQVQSRLSPPRHSMPPQLQGLSPPRSSQARGPSRASAPVTSFTTMHVAPQMESDFDTDDRRGASPTGHAHAAAAHSALPGAPSTPSTSVFAKNLYTDRKHEAKTKRASGVGKGLGIPLFGRMLRKKSVKSTQN